MTSAALRSSWAVAAVSKRTTYDGCHQGVVSTLFPFELFILTICGHSEFNVSCDTNLMEAGQLIKCVDFRGNFALFSVSFTRGKGGIDQSCSGLPALTAV